MGKVAIQNIKILTKRYTYNEWVQGKTTKGTPLTLDQGELGFDLTNLILKIGTADGQSWASAHEVCAAVLEHKYKVGNDYTTSKPTNVENYFVSKVEEVNSVSGTKLIYYYDKVIIPDAPALEYAKDITTTATKGGVTVIGGITQDTTNNHKLTETKIEVATPDQVDSKINTAAQTINSRIDGVGVNVTTDGDGSVVTGVKSVTKTGDVTSVVLSTGDLPDASGEVTATGTNGKTINYVKSVSLGVDSNGDYALTGNTDTITLPTGSGTAGEHTTTSTSMVTSVNLNDHTLTGNKKTLVAKSGSKVSVTGTNDQIQLDVDLSTFATKDELSASVNGATHYAGVIVPGTSTSPLDLSTVSDKTNGAFYIATATGYIIDTEYGIHDDEHKTASKTKRKINKDDSIILHHLSGGTDIHWDVIPAGDDVEYRPIKANGVEILGLSNSSAVDFISGDATVVTTNAGSNGEQQIKVSHADTSSVGNVTKTARQYIDSITFDDYGHVTGVTVGTEEDQFIPTISGSENVGGVGSTILAGFEVQKGTDGNYTVLGHPKQLTSDNTYIEIDPYTATENIEVKHKVINPISTTEATTLNFGDTFTSEVVTLDAAGHTTAKTTTTYTLPTVPTVMDDDTLYDMEVSADGNTAKVKLTETSTVNGTAGTTTTKGEFSIAANSTTDTPVDGFKVSVDGDTITLGGKASKDALGLIRAIASLTDDQARALGSAIQSFTGSHNDRLYGVNVTPNGQAFVEVPWVDTHTVAENFTTNDDVVKSADLYAFSTDTYGHIEQAHTVTVIDGNYIE